MVDMNKNKNTEMLLIGTKIKEQRLLKGLTQEQLSEKLGIDNKKLSRIETGQSMPSIKIAKAIAKVLNFNLYDLFDDSIDVQTEVPDNYFVQAVNILKSAKSKDEKKCYLNALKHTQNCLNLSSH